MVTSGEGAAWADIQRIAYTRNPHLSLKLYPALVQGDAAPASLVKALVQADQGGHDILIVGRGGGAEADLAAFDSESVVRAVAAVKTPVISAVGHESDYSLCDLAADLRAATPTHAAQIAVTSLAETLMEIADLETAMTDGAARLLHRLKQRVASCDPLRAIKSALLRYERKLAVESARLAAFSPQSTLERGYSIVAKADGSLVRAAAEVSISERITVYTAQGALRAIVEERDDG